MGDGADAGLEPPRDCDPQKLCLASKKYLLWRFPIENISWAQVTFLGVGIARVGIGQRKQVKVFRLIAEATMEARVYEGA